MTLTTSVITGRFPFPDDQVPATAALRFTLSGVDTEDSDVLHPASRTVALVAGVLPVGFALWRNVEGTRLTTYSVHLITEETDPWGRMTSRREVLIGTIQIGGLSSYALADLLVAPVQFPNIETYIAQIMAAAASTAGAEGFATAAEAASDAAAGYAADAQAIADGAAIWEEVGTGGRKALRATSLEELGALASIGQTFDQITVAASGYVIDAEDFQKIITVFSGGANWRMDARGIAPERVYAVRVWGNISYTLHLDFGEGIQIAGWSDTGNPTRGVTLTGGQTIMFAKSAEGYIYIHAVSAPKWRTEIAQTSPLFSYYEPMDGGYYRAVRRAALNAATTANFSWPSNIFAGNGHSRGPAVTSIVTHRLVGTDVIDSPCYVDGTVTDTSVPIRNPNGHPVHVTFTVEGLRISPPDLTTPVSQFMTDIPRLRAADQVPRPFCAIGAGQSLAEAGANRPRYSALTTYLRSTSDLTATEFLDWINTASGGSYADKGSAPVGSTNYWYDVAGVANGPLLTAALSAISTAVGAGKTIRFLTLNLGQADALAIGRGDNTKANYQTAMTAIVNALAAALPGTTKLYIEVIAGRSEAHAMGTQDVREAQLAIVAANANVDGMIDGYDVPLEDTVHPTYAGYRIYGERIGKLYKAAYSPPTISAATLSAGKITVTVGAIDLAATPVNTTFDWAGVKTGAGYIQARATVKSATSIELAAHPLSGEANLNAATHVAWPLADYPILGDGPFPVSAAGLPIKSALFAV